MQGDKPTHTLDDYVAYHEQCQLQIKCIIKEVERNIQHMLRTQVCDCKCTWGLLCNECYTERLLKHDTNLEESERLAAALAEDDGDGYLDSDCE